MTSYTDATPGFVLHTLHRGRFIQLLLAMLFLSGVLVSFTGIGEIAKIIVLLFALPVVLYVSIKGSQQPSTWTWTAAGRLSIVKGHRHWSIPLTDISYIRHHQRSGGNLIALYLVSKRQPCRFWRNKLFRSDDDFDTLMQHIKYLDIPVMAG